MPVGPLLEPEQKEKSFIPPLLIKALEKPRGGGGDSAGKPDQKTKMTDFASEKKWWQTWNLRITW